MQDVTLYLGSKEFSSWSLRAWLMLVQTQLDFKAVFIKLGQPNSQEKIAKVSPSGLLPALHFNGDIIWDSLSIGEYLAEQAPLSSLWPKETKLRAYARSISSEMHAGFQHLRQHLPFDLSIYHKDFSVPDIAKPDINRIINIWEDCLTQHNKTGPFLFGHFTIADAMYAPITNLFTSYKVAISPICADYVANIQALPEMKMWCEDI